MITKQPTIEDIYNFDAFITTPGVRDGLLERANSGDPELTTHDTDDGPVVYYNAPHGEEIAVGRPIQLAEVGATKMSDYGYSGERQATMTDYDPTVRERLAEFLQAGFERFGMDRYKARQNAQTLMGGPSSNLPLQTGIADIVPFLGTALQTQEAARLGGESVESAKRGEYGTAAAQAGFATLGMIPGAVGTVQASKALAPTAGKMAMDVAEKTGMPVRGLGIVEPSASAAGKATAPVSDTGFYSAVEQAALNIQRKSGTGQAFLNDITKGENVKADEVKWIGLDDFLKGKKNVTREEVQQYIAQNKVDIKEVTLGGAQEFDAQRLAQLESEYKALKQHPIDDPSFGEDKYDEMIRLMNIRDQSTTQTLYDAADQATRSAQRAQRQGNNITAEKYFREAELLNTRAEKLDLQGQGMSNPPKFGQYTLPGGENYREILLTLPAKERLVETQIPAAKQKPTVFAASNGKFELLDEMGETFATYNTKAEAEQAATDWAAPFTKTETVKDPEYHSSHWDQPNVLAHIRVNDRVDADGKKMLLVEEVQSDWHQAGRDKGYKSDVNPEENKALVKQWDTLANERRDLERIVATGDDADPSVQSAVQRLGEISNELNAVNDRLTQVRTTFREGVPDAPMKDTWYQLALKRVLKYAADNGYDRIGLTTGSRQAERYDLSKQVDKIEVPMINDDGSRSVRIDPTEGTSIKLTVDAEGNVKGYYGGAAAQFTGKRIDEVVGKEMADKIMSSNEPTTFTGVDLQVGGEGMRKYYDEVYPQFLAKYGKKWGAKVGETRIETEQSPKSWAYFREWFAANHSDVGGSSTALAQWESGEKSKYVREFLKQNKAQEPVRFVDITPEMREGVGKGQPLFTATGVGAGTAGATMQDKEQK